ncbi:MAG: Mrp/NBP35 family ATP-binding protein [Proteobacteria bacterium]|nr:Mrp/NBP35 family ATP-binding protein [Pseudomonadota bacterium]
MNSPQSSSHNPLLVATEQMKQQAALFFDHLEKTQSDQLPPPPFSLTNLKQNCHIQLTQKTANQAQITIHIPSDSLTLDHKSRIETTFFDFLNVSDSWQMTVKNLEQTGTLKVRLNFTGAKKKQTSGQSSATKTVTSSAQATIPRPLAKEPVKTLDHIGTIYCVASGKGGVGKSTVATQLALALAQKNLRIGILDGDIHGPSLPQLLDLKGPLQVTQDQKVIPLVSQGIKCVSFGFLSSSYHPAMWRGPLISKALQQFIFDVEWGQLDYLIIDLPPGTGDIPITMAEAIALDGAIIVTTAHPVALIDAHKAISMFQKLQIPIAGVIGNMIYHTCDHCGHNSALFGETKNLQELCAERSIKLLTELPYVKDSDLDAQRSPKSHASRSYFKALDHACELVRNKSHENMS